MLTAYPKVTQQVNGCTKSNAKLLAPVFLYFLPKPHWFNIIGQTDTSVLAEGKNKPHHLHFVKTGSWMVVSLYTVMQGVKEPKHKPRALSATRGSFPPHSTASMRCLHSNFPLLRMFSLQTSHLHPSVRPCYWGWGVILPFGYVGGENRLTDPQWACLPFQQSWFTYQSPMSSLKPSSTDTFCDG